MIYVFIDTYSPSDPARKMEVRFCARALKRLEEKGKISIVWMKNRNSMPPCYVGNNSFYYKGNRPFFSEWISEAKKRCQPGDISLLMNSDIYIDETFLSGLLELKMKSDEFLALTRYEIHPTICLANNPELTQDLWGFRVGEVGDGRLKKLEEDTTHSLGLPGCENRLAGAAWEAGFKLINPCRSLKILHIHHDNLRAYSEKDRIYGLYYFPMPAYIGEASCGDLGAFARPREEDEKLDLRTVRVFDGLTHRIYGRMWI